MPYQNKFGNLCFPQSFGRSLSIQKNKSVAVIIFFSLCILSAISKKKSLISKLNIGFYQCNSPVISVPVDMQIFHFRLLQSSSDIGSTSSSSTAIMIKELFLHFQEFEFPSNDQVQQISTRNCHEISTKETFV